VVGKNKFEWNDHWRLNGKHALLSPSGYHWLNYDDEKMQNVYLNNLRKEKGTRLHALASEMINLGVDPTNTRSCLIQFVLDAMGLGMESEKVLYYSDNVFGTADAIKYDEETNTLLVFDLKTGTSKPSFNQLLIYSAIFCLEYGFKPEKMSFLLRLYQGRGFKELEPEGKDVRECMKQIVAMDAVINKLKNEGY